MADHGSKMVEVTGLARRKKGTFHRPDCRHLGKAHNTWAMTLADAKEFGHGPCGDCLPDSK